MVICRDKIFIDILREQLYEKSQTSILPVIEWFSQVCLLRSRLTNYQNMAVMAVWRERWKRHTPVAIVYAVPLALWLSAYFMKVFHVRFGDNTPP